LLLLELKFAGKKARERFRRIWIDDDLLQWTLKNNHEVKKSGKGQEAIKKGDASTFLIQYGTEERRYLHVQGQWRS